MREEISRVLNPQMLRRLDRHLLTTRPWLWSTKIHKVVFYSVPVHSLVSIGLVLIFRQPHKINSLLTWLTILMGVELIAAILYMERVGEYFSIDPFGKTREWFRAPYELAVSLVSVSVIFAGSIVGVLLVRSTLQFEPLDSDPSTTFQTRQIIGSSDLGEFSMDSCAEALAIYDSAVDVDYEILKSYSGSTVESESDATDAYCMGLSNAITLFSFTHERESGLRAAFDFMHLIFIGALGWLGFANLNSPLPISATVLFVSFIYFTLAFLASLFARLVPSAFEQAEGVMLVSAAIFGAISTGSAILISRFQKRRSLSARRAAIVGVIVVTFPINLFLLLFTVLIPIAPQFRTIPAYAAFCLILPLGLAPYLRRRLILLYAIPRE